MSIDLKSEQLISLADAVEIIPEIDGKRPHISTLWRWCRRGIGGVKLDHVRLGHRICTTEDAVESIVSDRVSMCFAMEEMALSITKTDTDVEVAVSERLSMFAVTSAADADILSIDSVVASTPCS